MADTADTTDVVSFETAGNGDTTMAVTGYNEEGDEVVAYLTLTPSQIANLSGRTVKQAFGAAIIGA